MSLDKSLKVKNALDRQRNVLTRAERVEKLIAEEKWNEEQSVIGLAKTRVARIKIKKKVKAKDEEDEAAAEGEGAVEAQPAEQ